MTCGHKKKGDIMDKVTEGFKSIEEMKQEKSTPDAVYAGVKAYSGWKTGKIVSEAEYDAAVKAFESAPMDGEGKG